MTWTTAAAIYLVVAAPISLVLVFIGDFSVRQSVVLALLTTAVLRLSGISANTNLRFNPYWVRVSPKWYELLADFKLIDSAEEWDTLQKHAEEMASRNFNILTHWICFTVVSEPPACERKLIYWNNYHSFASDVDFEERIEPSDIGQLGRDLEPEDRGRQIDALRLRGVSFFMKSRGPSYNLGLMVPDCWWDKIRDSCPKPIEENRISVIGQVELTLARISYPEFDFYCRPERWDKHYEKSRKRLGDLRDKQRDKLGWRREDHRVSDALIEWPESLEHKYRSVLELLHPHLLLA